MKKFGFLDDIARILIDFGLCDFSLIVACDGSDDNINDFETKYINETTHLLTNILYEHTINNFHCDNNFSNIIISHKK